MKIVLGLHLRKETVPYKTCEEKEIVTPWEQGSHDFATKKILCFFELVFKYAFHLLMVLPSPTKNVCVAFSASQIYFVLWVVSSQCN